VRQDSARILDHKEADVFFENLSGKAGFLRSVKLNRGLEMKPDSFKKAISLTKYCGHYSSKENEINQFC